MSYQVYVTAGTGNQVENGELRLTYTSFGGAYILNATKVSSEQALSSGTLTVSFAATAAATSTVSVTATTSLGTPTVQFWAMGRCFQPINNAPAVTFN
jgi:hypothetical protein